VHSARVESQVTSLAKIVTFDDVADVLELDEEMDSDNDTLDAQEEREIDP
jgi:hypothetical protein